MTATLTDELAPSAVRAQQYADEGMADARAKWAAYVASEGASSTERFVAYGLAARARDYADLAQQCADRAAGTNVGPDAFGFLGRPDEATAAPLAERARQHRDAALRGA